MPVVEIAPRTHWIGVNDRTTDLFEGLWPIAQEGVSYNAYLIDDTRKTIIDLAKAFKTDEFFEKIGAVIDLASLDYVIINHLEPDHTGVLTTLLKIAPRVTILCSEKCREMLSSFYGITARVQAVSDGEEVSLGERRLRFYMTPHVHWPETMMTYLVEERILFSCDAFGGYGALRGALFDDQCTDLSFYEKEALRYYVNIVAKFSGPVLRAIEKLSGLELRVVAPSHGLIWRRSPDRIVSLYQHWASYAGKPGDPAVTLVYGSMYGQTEKMMNAVAEGVSSVGVDVAIFDAARTHASYILPELWIRAGVLIGSPTYEGGLFPPVATVMDMAVVKRIQKKRFGIFGSYGWSGGAQQALLKRMEPLGWSLVDRFEFCGVPTPDDYARGMAFGMAFGMAVQTAEEEEHNSEEK